MPDPVKGKVGDEEEDIEPGMVVIDETDPESVKAGEDYKARLKALNTAPKDDDEDEDDEPTGDRRLGVREDAGADDGSHARGEETDEQRKERRRQWKRNKKKRVAEARHRDQVERQYLESQNERLERQVMELRGRQSNAELLVLDTAISNTESQLAQADSLLAEAVEANNGADVARMTTIKGKIEANLAKLKAAKEGTATRRQQDTQVEQEAVRRPRGNPATEALALQFQQRNPWFIADPRRRDRDSQIAAAVDQALSLDTRFDAATPKYWKELDRRLKDALPHRYEVEGDDDFDDDDDQDDPPPQRRQTPDKKGNGGPRMPGGGGNNGGREVFHLTRERKEAMIEHGVWDDPKLRAKYIAKYREWDRNNASRRGDQ